MKQIASKKQRGATLIVSMGILVVLTIIGISAMSNSAMQSNMARNFQLGKTDFQLSESVIARLIFLASQGPADNPISTYNINNDIIRNVATDVEGSFTDTTYTAATVDPGNKLGAGSGVAVASRVTFDWNRESEMCPGGAGTGSCNVYTVQAATFLDGVTPSSEHGQNIWIVVPQTNN
jgi:Tfp pilus assembly protein PilV